jgi:Ca2+-binding EF-hand superfamily protein
MGVSTSYQLPKHFAAFTSWPSPKVSSAIKAYEAGEYDFGIDHTVIMTLTGLNLEESKVLVKAFSRNQSGVVNAMVFFSAVLMLAEPNRRVTLYQPGAIFDLYDFDKTGQLSMDEFTIMLSCVGLSCALILSRVDECLDDESNTEFAKGIYAKLGKVNGAPISKSEVLGVVKEYFDDHDVKTVDQFFGRLVLGKDCLEWKDPDADSSVASKKEN